MTPPHAWHRFAGRERCQRAIPESPAMSCNEWAARGSGLVRSGESLFEADVRLGGVSPRLQGAVRDRCAPLATNRTRRASIASFGVGVAGRGQSDQPAARGRVALRMLE